MILNDLQIQTAIEQREIVIEPFDMDSIEPATYDLKVGKEGITTKEKLKRNIQESGFIVIEPGDFALVLTDELIHLNEQHTGRFGLRSKYARAGLIATVGTQVDPGFNGCLKVGLVNMSTKAITLPYREHFLSIEFHKLEQKATKKYSGPYQGQTSLNGPDFEQIVEQGKHTFSEAFESLRVLSTDVSELAKTVEGLAKTVQQHASSVEKDIDNLDRRFDGELGQFGQKLDAQLITVVQKLDSQTTLIQTELKALDSRVADKKADRFNKVTTIVATIALIAALLAWLFPAK